MSKKNKLQERFVYSIYSKELEDYPYFPFFAKNNTMALKIFFKMLIDEKKICKSPELHLIGKVKLRDNMVFSVEPSLYVYKIGLNTKEAVNIYRSVEFEEKVRHSLNRFFLKHFTDSIIIRKLEQLLHSIKK